MKTFFALILALASLTAASALAADTPEYTLAIKDHVFSPDVLEVPAGQRIRLKVVNQDATAEEFESHELNREKVVSGNSTISIFLSPLKAGEYSYFGDFHPKEAKGKIVAK